LLNAVLRILPVLGISNCLQDAGHGLSDERTHSIVVVSVAVAVSSVSVRGAIVAAAAHQLGQSLLHAPTGEATHATHTTETARTAETAHPTGTTEAAEAAGTCADKTKQTQQPASQLT
jgi:hypothetical protein